MSIELYICRETCLERLKYIQSRHPVLEEKSMDIRKQRTIDARECQCAYTKVKTSRYGMWAHRPRLSCYSVVDSAVIVKDGHAPRTPSCVVSVGAIW